MSRNFFSALACATLLAACNGAAPTNSTSKGYVIDPSQAWPSSTIPVCWENGTPATYLYQLSVQAAVTGAYNNWTNVKFTGWGPCISSEGLHIEIYGGGPTSYEREPAEYDGHPRARGLGKVLGGMQPGIILNPSLHNIRPGMLAMVNSLSEFEKLNLHVSIALHEFGHVLGLKHEQSRPDSSCSGFEDSNMEGGYVVGDDDPYSVMNYCHTHDSLYTQPIFLSAGDIEAVNALYP